MKILCRYVRCSKELSRSAISELNHLVEMYYDWVVDGTPSKDADLIVNGLADDIFDEVYSHRTEVSSELYSHVTSTSDTFMSALRSIVRSRMGVTGSRSIKGSRGEDKVTAKSWSELIDKIATEEGIDVDSAYRRHYEQWLIGYDRSGQEYEIEVTKYSDGTYEVLHSNIR